MRTLIAALALLMVVGVAGSLITDAQDSGRRPKSPPPRAPETMPPPRMPDRVWTRNQEQGGTWQLHQTSWGVLKLNTVTGETFQLREDAEDRVYWGLIPHADEGRARGNRRASSEREELRARAEKTRERSELRRRADGPKSRQKDIEREIDRLRDSLDDERSKRERRAIERRIDDLEDDLEQVEQEAEKSNRRENRKRR